MSMSPRDHLEVTRQGKYKYGHNFCLDYLFEEFLVSLESLWRRAPSYVIHSPFGSCFKFVALRERI